MKRQALVSTVGAMCAALAIAGCGTVTAEGGSGGGLKSGPGIDEDSKTITVGNITALSGPASLLGKGFTAGESLYWKARNAEGGIDGWKVKQVDRDSAYNTQLHVQTFSELKDDIAMLTSFGSSATKAIQPTLEREKLVTVGQNLNPADGVDVIAQSFSSWHSSVANLVGYFTKEGADKKKVGLIFQNDDMGADGRDGYQGAVKTYGLDDVGQEAYVVGDTDFTGQIQKLKRAGAEVVILVSTAGSTGPIIGAAASVGFNPTFGVTGGGYVENLMTSDGTAEGKKTPIAEALDREVYLASPITTLDDNDSTLLQQMKDDIVAVGDGIRPGFAVTFGYAFAHTEAKILEKAIADGDLSREGILEAKMTLGEVDFGGLSPNPTFGEGEDSSLASHILKIDSGAEGFLTMAERDYTSKASSSLD